MQRRGKGKARKGRESEKKRKEEEEGMKKNWREKREGR